MLTVVEITAKAFNRETGTPLGVARTERIDVLGNKLFQHCTSIMDVKQAFESFWNELNPHSEEVVFVQEVSIVY